jgi:hypothetical protein
VLITGLAAVGLPRVLDSGSLPSVPAVVPPPFFVAILVKGGGAVQVFSSQTGRPAGRLAEPSPQRRFQSVAAAGTEGTFVAAATQGCHTWFYRFQLTAQGQPTGLTPVRGPGVAGVPSGLASALTVSADGSTLAYATVRCSSYELRADAGQVGVIRLATGQLTTWRYRFPATPHNLTLSADGRLLGFVSAPSTGRGGQDITNSHAYLLRTDSPPGPLGQRYHAVLGPPRAPYAAALNPDGTAFFAAIPAPRAGKQVPRQTLGNYRIPDGTLAGPRRVLPRLPFLNFGITLKPDATGRFVLMYQWNDRVQRIDLATGTITTVPGKAAQFAQDAAW